MHYKKSVFRSLAMITQLGLCVITPVFLCVFIGYQVDSHLGGSVMIPMVILGVLSGTGEEGGRTHPKGEQSSDIKNGNQQAKAVQPYFCGRTVGGTEE